MANKKRRCYLAFLIAASILVARHYDQLRGKPQGAVDNAIAEAITLAERILQSIDSRAAAAGRAAARPPDQFMTSSADYPWKSRP